MRERPCCSVREFSGPDLAGVLFACSEQEPEAEGELADHRGDGHDEEKDSFVVVVVAK